MAFAVDGDPDTQNRFVAALRVITSAVSLGHDESLIVHVGTGGPRVVHAFYFVRQSSIVKTREGVGPGGVGPPGDRRRDGASRAEEVVAGGGKPFDGICGGPVGSVP